MHDTSNKPNPCKSSSDISEICKFSLDRQILLCTDYVEDAIFTTQKNLGLINVFMRLVRYFGMYGDMKISLEEIRCRTGYKSRSAVRKQLQKLQKMGYLVIHKQFTPKSVRCHKGYLANSYTITKLLHYDYQIRLKNITIKEISTKIKACKSPKALKKLKAEEAKAIAQIQPIIFGRIDFKKALDKFVAERTPEVLEPRPNKPFFNRRKKSQKTPEKPIVTLIKKEEIKPVDNKKLKENEAPEIKPINRQQYFETAFQILQIQIARDPSKMPKICDPLHTPLAPYKPKTLSENIQLKKKRDLELALSQLKVKPWNIPMVPLAEYDSDRIKDLASNMANLHVKSEEQKKLYNEVLFFDQRHGMNDFDVNAQLTSDERFHEYIKRSPNYRESVWA